MEQVATAHKEQAAVAVPILIDATVLKPFEIGARLDALLCYPRFSVERRQRIADAICAQFLANSIAVDASRKAELWSAYPNYKISQSRASLKTLPKRRDEALTAGLAFLPLLKNAAIGELPILNGRQRELSLGEIGRFLWPAAEGGFEINYGGRLHDRMNHGLRRYYPIAHLAAAYQYIARERSGDAIAAPFDYQDLEFHREVVRRANEFAGYFAATPKWAKIAKGLVPIEWHE